MPMIFFYFLKIIFDISTSKRSKKYKPHSILIKKKFKFNGKTGAKRSTKRSHTPLLRRLQVCLEIQKRLYYFLKYFLLENILK
jgi:hypothetical protein